MAFADRLKDFPIVLEIVPPRKRASEKTIRTFVSRVREALPSIPRLDAINLPEIIDENHAGRPFYRNMDPRQCAALLNEGLRVEPIVNKVVVHLDGADGLDAWVRESYDTYRLRNFVFVGGSSSRVTYPGPAVVEANAHLQGVARDHADVACGNVTIPERPGEVARLLRKTAAGSRFFTTQVLFEPEPMATVLREYGEACDAEGLDPATVLLSFAPVADYEDVEFLMWLGASVTPETEEALLVGGSEAGVASLDVARSIFTRIRDLMAAATHPVPIGVNVEEITTHNFDLAVRMAREFPAWKDKAP